MASSAKISPSLLLGSSLLLTSAASHAELYPQEQWACLPSSDGGWQCKEQSATPGHYPKPPVMEPITTQRYKKQPKTSETKAAKVSPQPQDQWDWVAKEQLDNASQCRTGCDGSFQAPKADWPESDQQPEDAPVRAEAEQSATEGEVITMEGDVVITQGHRQVKTDDAVLNRSRNNLALSGKVEIREPGLLIRADSGHMNTETGLGQLENARFVQHNNHMHGTADTVIRSSEFVVEMDQAMFSQCEPADKDWLMKTSSLTLDEESGRGVAKHARLHVGGVPILYTPYISFPIDDRRQTGFLWPTIGSNSGGDLTVPYYINIAPNYDLTLAPRYIADHGNMTEVEGRSLHSYGDWTLSGSYLASDNYENEDPAKNLEGEDRWLGSIEHSGQFADNWQTRVDYSKVSDNEFFNDFSLNSVNARRSTHLDQKASLSYNTQDWLTTLEVAQYQTIDSAEEAYKRLPQLTVEKRSETNNFAPNLLFVSQYTDFDHDDDSKAIGERLYGEAGVSFPMQYDVALATLGKGLS